MKICTKCGVIKTRPEFSKGRNYEDGLYCWCKACAKAHQKDYQRTKVGVSGSIYYSQRLSSVRRNHPPPSYTKQQLKDWLFNQELFHKLYDSWVASDYDRKLKPSCDRTDDYLSYSLGRLQLMTWQENNDKGNSDRKNGINNKANKAVSQYSKDGKPVGEYPSAYEAHRRTGISRGNISLVCNGKRKTAGGFIWEY